MNQTNKINVQEDLKMKKASEIKQKSKFTRNTVIIYLSCMYILPIFVIMSIGMILGIIEGAKGIALNVSDLTSNSRIYINSFSYLVLTFYIYNKHKSIYKEAFKDMKKSNLLKKSIIISVFVVVINYTTGTLLNMFGGQISNNQSIIDSYVVSNFIITMITFVLLAPFVEEIIYRYIIQNWAKKFGIVVSIFVSSIIFSLVHYSGGSLLAMIQYVVLGLCFAIIYYKTKNIAVVFTVHALNNFIVLILGLFL